MSQEQIVKCPHCNNLIFLYSGKDSFCYVCYGELKK